MPTDPLQEMQDHVNQIYVGIQRLQKEFPGIVQGHVIKDGDLSRVQLQLAESETKRDELWRENATLRSRLDTAHNNADFWEKAAKEAEEKVAQLEAAVTKPAKKV